MIRRQSSVRERRRLRQLEIVDGQQLPGLCDEVFRHPAVYPQPDAANGHDAARVVESGEARHAPAAAPEPDDGDRLPAFEAGHAGAERFDPAGVLMSEREWRRQAERVRRVDDVEVGVADACGSHLHQHLARARLWLRDGAVLRRLRRGENSEGLHGSLLSDSGRQPAGARYGGPGAVILSECSNGPTTSASRKSGR